MSRRGFASLSPEKRKFIAQKGGRAAHQSGRAHEWTHDQAVAAGKKGGRVRRKVMADEDFPLGERVGG